MRMNIFTVACIFANFMVVVNGRAAPSPAHHCRDIEDCIAYLIEGSLEESPNPSCCKGLKNVIDEDFDCICRAIDSAAGKGYNVNMTKVDALPSTCSVNSPPLSSCKAKRPATLTAAAPAPLLPSLASGDCSILVYDFVDCMSFLSQGSNDSKPSDGCCSGYKSIANKKFGCICEALSTAPRLEFEVNYTRADNLPSLCEVKSPAISTCNVSSSPSPPVPSPPGTSISSPAPSTGNTTDCISIALGMMDCISYLTPGASVTKPSSTCCTGYKSVVNADFDCVCVALKTAPSMGFPIDESKAEKMPSLCKVKSPPVSYCNSGSGTPNGSPSGSPPAQSPPPAGLPASPPPSAAPAPRSSAGNTSDCSTIAYNMEDCISYLTPGAAVPKPSSTCCTGYRTVVNADFNCVCVALKVAPSIGFQIDESKAEKLPSVCKVKSPPVSSCISGSGSPPPAAATPGNSPPSSSATPAGSPESSPSPTSPGVVPASPASPPGEKKSSAAETTVLSFMFALVSSLSLFVALS